MVLAPLCSIQKQTNGNLVVLFVEGRCRIIIYVWSARRLQQFQE